MEFKITTASGDGRGTFGITEKIKQLNNTTYKIRTLNDLKKLSEDVDTELIIDFKKMEITIYDYYLG